VTSEFRKLLRLEYGLWRYPARRARRDGFAAAVAHIVGVGNYTDAGLKQTLWLAITLGWIGADRLDADRQADAPARGALARRREPRRAGRRRTLVLEPEGHGGFADRWPRPVRLAHPAAARPSPCASIRSAWRRRLRRAPRLAFGIKPLRATSPRSLRDAPGERAYLDGPYGVFSIDASTGCRGFRLRRRRHRHHAGDRRTCSAMAARGDRRPTTLFYCNRTWEDVVYREEIEALKDRLDLKVVHVLEEPPEGWEGEEGFLDRGVLERHLPEGARDREYFLCGMKVIVLGAGVIGVTTAWYLARRAPRSACSTASRGRAWRRASPTRASSATA
jgi:hypothetical protein